MTKTITVSGDGELAWLVEYSIVSDYGTTSRRSTRKAVIAAESLVDVQNKLHTMYEHEHQDRIEAVLSVHSVASAVVI